MTGQPAVPGVAFLCDDRGMVQEVILNGLGITGLIPGQSLTLLVDPGSRIKLLNYLVELRRVGAAFDWEINLPSEAGAITLRLTGLVEGSDLLIIGGRSSEDVQRLWEEMSRINSEQATALRLAIKSQAQAARGGDDANLYDEISRLNNELVTLQRNLAKKNVELERLYAELERLAVTDPLTGVLNRRGFFTLGEREVARAGRYGRPLAAVMFDLDYFKRVNDLFGHLAGDQVLAEIAARCAGQLRQVDIFGRYGGEEFVLLLPDTDLETAVLAAERLRQGADKPVQVDDQLIPVSISLGVAAWQAEQSLQGLLEQADQALYQAKKLGRNRVFYASV